MVNLDYIEVREKAINKAFLIIFGYISVYVSRNGRIVNFTQEIVGYVEKQKKEHHRFRQCSR